MGICCESITATDEMIDRLHTKPALIWRLYAPDDPDICLEEIRIGCKPGWIGRYRVQPSAILRKLAQCDAAHTLIRDEAGIGRNAERVVAPTCGSAARCSG